MRGGRPHHFGGGHGGQQALHSIAGGPRLFRRKRFPAVLGGDADGARPKYSNRGRAGGNRPRGRWLGDVMERPFVLVHARSRGRLQDDCDVAASVREGQAPTAAAHGVEALKAAGIERVEYLDVRDAETLAEEWPEGRAARVFIAVHLGETRLIDNVAV